MSLLVVIVVRFFFFLCFLHVVPHDAVVVAAKQEKYKYDFKISAHSILIGI